MAGEDGEPLKITLDIDATVRAVVWPIVVVVVVYLLREKIPALVKGLAGRITKLDIAGVTLEFAKAKEFNPEFASATAGLDLRHRASAVEVNDSTAGTFINQLRDPAAADYAIVRLGAGDQWLSSRLYIMAVVFARMKGLSAFVFLDQSGPDKRYLGWADPNKIRWALARKYPWLEAAYAAAYADVFANPTAVVTSPTGRLGYQYNRDDPGPSIELLRKFLQRIQWPPAPGVAPLAPAGAPVPPLPDAADWVLIDKDTQAREHSAWVNGTLLEEILGDELNSSHIGLDALRGASRNEQTRSILAQDGHYVAVTQQEHRFMYLIDRSMVLEHVAQALVTEGEKS